MVFSRLWFVMSRLPNTYTSTQRQRERERKKKGNKNRIASDRNSEERFFYGTIYSIDIYFLNAPHQHGPKHADAISFDFNGTKESQPIRITQNKMRIECKEAEKKMNNKQKCQKTLYTKSTAATAA